MEVEEIYIEENAFGTIIREWASTFNNVETHLIEARSNFDLELVDGLVVFHENHDISKHRTELIDLFEARQKGVSKIDLNGTLSVARSSFQLWIERNNGKRILIVGSEKLAKNINVSRFLEEMPLR